MEFKIGDIVALDNQSGHVEVTGVIHDDKRLFVTGEDLNEFEVPFSRVVRRWREKAL